MQKLLGQVLEIGDVAEYEGLRFEVLTLDGKGRQTGRIRVTKLESA